MPGRPIRCRTIRGLRSTACWSRQSRWTRVAAAVGSTLVMTDRRLFVVRDGARFRPRSGVRWWPLERDLTLRLARVRHDTSRLVIAREGRSASVFLTGTQVGDVQGLIAEIRHRTYADG